MRPTEKWLVKSIMLAEDAEDDRIMFKNIIQQVNPQVNVQIVPNGRQLLFLLDNIIPDLVFLDLDMPYKNGLECLLAIRNNKKLGNLPVVMFSSTTRQSNIQTAYEMGAHLFLIKSSYFRKYISAIDAILKLDWRNPDENQRTVLRK